MFDVNVNNAQDGDHLIWSSTANRWQTTNQVAGVGVLSDLTDVNTSGVEDGQLLAFDSASGVWVPADQAGASLFQASWRFDTSTSASDPGSRNFRYDNAIPASVTNIYVSDTNNDNNDMSNILGFLSSGDQIYLQQSSDSANALLFDINGTPTDNTDWWTLPITVTQSGSLPGNNSVCGWAILF